MQPGYHKLPPPAPQYIPLTVKTSALPVINATTTAAAPVKQNSAASIVAREFHYFAQYVASVVENKRPNITRCMIQLNNLLFEITEKVENKPHDVDTIKLMGGIIFFHIFWLSYYLGYDTFEHIPKRQLICAKMNKQEQICGLHKMHKQLSAIFSFLLSHKWKQQQINGRIKQCLLKTGQIILNITNVENIHELLEIAIEGVHIEKSLIERNDQAKRNRHIALELETLTIYPLLYKVENYKQCNIDNNRELHSLLKNSGVTENPLTLRKVATRIHNYLLNLICRGYKKKQILAILTNVFKMDCFRMDLFEKRMLLYPLTNKLIRMSYVTWWNMKYPKQTHLYNYKLPAITEMEQKKDSLESLNEDNSQKAIYSLQHPQHLQNKSLEPIKKEEDNIQ